MSRPRAATSEQHPNGLEIHRLGQGGISIACRGTYDGRERDEDVGFPNQSSDHSLVANIPGDEGEPPVRAEVEEALLAVHQVVEDGDVKPPEEKGLAQDRAEVAGASSNKDPVGHARVSTEGIVRATVSPTRRENQSAVRDI